MASTSKKKEVDISTKMLPNNLEAEQGVLCCAMTDQESCINIVAKLSPADFYSGSHKTIYEAIVALYQDNQPVDLVTLTDKLESKNQLQEIGGVSYLTTLMNFLPSAAYYQSYVDIVKRNAVSRQLIATSNKIIQNVYNGENGDALGFAEKSIFEIAEKGQVSALENLADSLTGVMENFEDIHKDGAKVRGIPTGFYQLDKMTNGLQRSDLILVAARPSVGKTSLAMNIVTNAAIEGGAKCAVFSLEMSKAQLAQRMLCSVANVDMSKALHGELDVKDWEKLWKAHKKLSECKIYADDSSLNTPSQILSKCRKLKRERGLDLIMIDYLQLMTGDAKSDNRQTEVSDISRRMKILAKEINVPVILLSQLSRAVEQRQNKLPVLSDLRESGAIEQDADMVIFIHRPDKDNAATEDVTKREERKEQPKDYQVQLIIAKHRNGELGSIPLAWVGSRVSFANLTRDEDAKSLEASLENGNMQPPPEITEIPGDISDLDDTLFDN